MCGRYLLDVYLDDIRLRYQVSNYIDFEPLKDIFPSNKVPVILSGYNNRLIKKLIWGFSPYYMKKLLINARSETISEKSTFKDSFINRRCIIPASGFFEWEKVADKKVKRKINVIDNKVFSIAGIYNKFKDNDGNDFFAFTILTKEANDIIKPIHNRMPVILKKEEENLWLDRNNKNILLLKNIINKSNPRLSII